MKNSSEKTNVMRILGQHKIPYASHTYSGVISGADVAAALGQDPHRVFKTLVFQIRFHTVWKEWLRNLLRLLSSVSKSNC